MNGVWIIAAFAIVGDVTPAWQTLDKALQGDQAEKYQALAALSTIESNEDAAKRVEGALQDKDPQVRQAAALALGQMKTPQAISYLKQALTDTGEVAFAAAKSLVELGDPSGREMLLAVLAGERKDTPGMMAEAIRDTKKKLRHPEGLFLMGARDAAGVMFGPPVPLGFSMGSMAAKDLVDWKAKGAPGRAAAAAYLAKDPEPYAVTLLEWALSDDNQFVRLEAARGLGARGNANSIPKLEPLLNDPHNKVRTMAAASIIRLSQ